MPIIFQQHQGFIDFANDVLDGDFVLNDEMTITQLSDDGKIQAVLVFSNFSNHNVELSIATDEKSAISPAFFRALYTYAFIDCNKRRVTVIVNINNTKSLRFVERLGYVKEGELKHFYGDLAHGMVFGLLKENCKWIKRYLKEGIYHG